MYKLFLLSKVDNENKKSEQKTVADVNSEELINKRAKAMYSLMNEAARLIKIKDTNHPVALCNGDVAFLE